jgi:hypothetical protein
MGAEILETALRVITAISEREHPDPDDVAALKAYAPQSADLPIEELVCDVINDAIRHRPALRKSGRYPL